MSALRLNCLHCKLAKFKMELCIFQGKVIGEDELRNLKF